ncbi:hypothetical protein FKW77_010084 [Venturia effusa]|uniref:Uncharacterized protein n=1 Tax=Venturia effusa TaxID=50376 RepID=A0A517L694_9PEZI|nr:hypothetical protein FKW77_010084 [Venturia effusa]
MLMMQKLGENEIDVQREWQTYVRTVRRDHKYFKLYPDLKYNPDTWEKDLRAHIIVRRRRYFDGSEARERDAAQKAAKVPRLSAAAANQSRQDAKNNKGKGDKAQTIAGKEKGLTKWGEQKARAVQSKW